MRLLQVLHHQLPRAAQACCYVLRPLQHILLPRILLLPLREVDGADQLPPLQDGHTQQHMWQVGGGSSVTSTVGVLGRTQHACMQP